MTALAFGSVAQARAADKVVSYHGYQLTVPASWPVFDLGHQPTVCVRFDRHAVYLGKPGAGQRCPAHVIGRTEAILVSPTAAGGPAGGGPSAPALPPMINSGSSAPNSIEFSVPSHQITVAATWARQPALIERALGIGTLPALVRRSRASATATIARTKAHAIASGAVYTGRGFDVCSTPSTGTMAAWGSSPYRAIGVYVGGANLACSQSNLTPAWTERETGKGWHLILIYVGLQAPSNSCGCDAISPGAASYQGTAAAADAIAHAQALGIGPGNPIYDDMEAYPRTSSNASAVLAFLSGWTSELHSQGYVSGAYSSTGSGIADLVRRYGTGYLEPDDIWIAHWNGEQTTSDPSVPPGFWADHHRLHQYDGGVNETWGGVTLNIDHDYIDGATAGSSCSSEFAGGTFIEVAGSSALYRIAGGAPLLVSDWNAVGGVQPVTVVSPKEFDSLCQAPVNGTFLVGSTGLIYRVAGGAPLAIPSWNVFGGIQPYVEVDQWDLDNLGTAAAHLNPVPANGTVVEGLPSHRYWTFSRARRMFGGLRPQAVAVADAGLARFPVVPCVVPRLRRLTLPRVRKALAKADCRLGKLRRPRHVARTHKLRVIWQVPAGGTKHAAGWLVRIGMQ